MDPPYTDQYSIGVDREVANNLGVSVTYVHKESQGPDRLEGRRRRLRDAGRDGAQRAAGDRVSAAQQRRRARRFVRTNGDGFFSRYNGLMLGLSRRLANRWAANMNYTLFGRHKPGAEIEPDHVNDGKGSERLRQSGGPRTRSIGRTSSTLSGSYEIPKVEVQVSGNLALTSGRPYGAQFQVRLPQGQRNVYFEAPGAYYRPSQQWLHLRINKILFRRGPHRHRAGRRAPERAARKTSIDNLITSVFSSPNFGKAAQWATPRQLMFRVRAYW